MKAIIHYLKVYSTFVSTSFTEAMSFRASFILLILMDIFFYFSALATVDLIFDHVSTIGPWQKDQLMFYIAFMLTIDHLHMTLVSESFWAMAQQLKTGEMDYLLLKPIGSVFIVFFRYIRPSTMLNTILVWPGIVYFGMQAGLSGWDWFFLPILVLLGFSLLVVLEFVLSTSMFWMTEGIGINFLRMQIQSLARWPEFIYHGLMRKILYIAFPILMIGSVPVHFLFHHSSWWMLLVMILAIALASFILKILWAKGLRRYESASS